MGGSQAASWQPPTHLYNIIDYGYCRVWVRKGDQLEHIEEYRLQIHSQQQMQQYQNMFALRMEQNMFPLSMYFINSEGGFLCGTGTAGSILIQRIPYRMSQFSNIPYVQAVSILSHCLNAYWILNKAYGLFRVTNTMIGLDRNYRVKVWHHTDLSSPHPQDPYCYTLTDMISSIVRSVQFLTSLPYEFPTFSEYLERSQTCLYSFQLAINMMQQYAQRFQLRLQSQFQYFQRYLKRAEGLLEAERSNSQRSSRDHSQAKSQDSRNRSNGKFSFKTRQVVVENPRANNIYYDKFQEELHERVSEIRMKNPYHIVNENGRNVRAGSGMLRESRLSNASNINMLEESRVSDRSRGSAYNQRNRAATQKKSRFATTQPPPSPPLTFFNKNVKTTPPQPSPHLMPATYLSPRSPSPQANIYRPYYDNKESKGRAASTSARSITSLLSIGNSSIIEHNGMGYPTLRR